MKIIRLYSQIAPPPAAAPAPPASEPSPRVFVPGQSPGTLKGTATVYNQLSSDLGDYRIRILPGAFADSIKSRFAFAAWQHDDRELLASTKNRSLRLRDDAKGLRCEIDLAPTGRGWDAWTLVSGNYLAEMSVGFSATAIKFVTEKNRSGEKITVEEVSKGILWEVSIVYAGAMPGTSITAMTPTTTGGLSRRDDRARIADSIRRIKRFASCSTMTRDVAAMRTRIAAEGLRHHHTGSSR